MLFKKKEVVLFGIILVMFVLAGVFYQYLPNIIPTHWNAGGYVNDYGSKGTIFIFPVLALIIYIFFGILPKVEVYKKHIQQFKALFGLKTAIVLFLLILEFAVISYAAGHRFKMNQLIIPLISALFIYTGYIIRDVKRNYFIGIRTPWALANETVWKKTHELGGKLFMIVGVILLLALVYPEYFVLIVLVPIIVLMIFLFIYSYIIYSHKKR